MSSSKPITETGQDYPVSGYRWIMLILFMFVTAMNQVGWVTFMPFARDAAIFYGVSDLMIVTLGTSFMILYLFVNFPACWLIDKFGLKWGVGIGVILNGVFAFLRAFAGKNFAFLMFCQIMLAIAQPFFLNSFTKVAVVWFPESEKTTASGLGTISTFLGAIIGMMVPEFMDSVDISFLLLLYGIITLISSLLYLAFAKEKPESPPNPYADKTKVLVTQGYRDMFKIRDFNYTLFILFAGIGVFNAITTKIDYLFDPNWDSGIISGVMVIGGILGAIVFSGISDALHKRKVFIILAVLSAIPLSILLIYVTDEIIGYVIAGLFGFLLVSALPVGLTYAAEITYPIPEESSNGLSFMLGQVGGLILLYAVPDNLLLWISVVFFAIATIFGFLLKDTPEYEKLRRSEAPKSSDASGQ